MEATFHPASPQTPKPAPPAAAATTTLPALPPGPAPPPRAPPAAPAPRAAASVQRRQARAPPPKAPVSRVVVPIRYSAWTNGDIGRSLERQLEHSLGHLMSLRITRMQRSFLVEADEEPGVMLESVQRAVEELERSVQTAFPVFHHQFGPVWTGTLQSVFT